MCKIFLLQRFIILEDFFMGCIHSHPSQLTVVKSLIFLLTSMFEKFKVIYISRSYILFWLLSVHFIWAFTLHCLLLFFQWSRCYTYFLVAIIFLLCVCCCRISQKSKGSIWTVNCPISLTELKSLYYRLTMVSSQAAVRTLTELE